MTASERIRAAREERRTATHNYSVEIWRDGAHRFDFETDARTSEEARSIARVLHPDCYTKNVRCMGPAS
jgi:hypothetical protein